jgi:hypothetical protein
VEDDRKAWVNEKLAIVEGHPVAQARLLLLVPDTQWASQRAAELGAAIEEHYWQEFSPYGLGPNYQFVNESAEQLLRHNRPLTALQLLEVYVHVGPENGVLPSPALIAEGLEQLVKLPSSHQEQARQLSAYDIDRMLAYLADSDIGEDRVATLEWQFLPVRGYGERNYVLDRHLARDPAFFVEILSLCYKRSDGTTEPGVTTEMASNAYHLLSEWCTVPGEAGGEIVEEKLFAWATEVRRLAAERDRGRIADHHIGQILSKSYERQGEPWPVESVRNTIERLSSSALVDGFITGTFNERGVTTRTLEEGGRQERELAQKYGSWADQLADEWPRTARALRSVAEWYLSQAQREDEESERYRRGAAD